MMERASSKPFMFDKSFDLAAMKAAEEKKIVKTYSEEEMALIKEQAYSQGFVAGKEAALGEIQQQQATVMSHINRLFERLAQDVWNVYAQQRQVASDIALTIARKIVPEYLKKNGLAEMTAAIESCLGEMINEPRLVLRVHEQHFDYVKREIDGMAERLGYAGKMIILADQTLGEHDCRLEWADGGMERNIDITWSEIDRHVARHSGAAPVLASTPPLPSEHPTSTTTIAV